MKGGCCIMKNNIVYVDFTQRSILTTPNTSFLNSIKRFIRKLFMPKKFKAKKIKSGCKRIPTQRYFS